MYETAVQKSDVKWELGFLYTAHRFDLQPKIWPRRGLGEDSG